jgi:cytochrome P450
MAEPTPRIPSAPGPEPMPIIGAIGNLVRYMRDPLVASGRLFARYGNVVSIVRAPVRMANPGPGWGTGKLATATGAGVVIVNGADLNREVLTQHDRFHMIALPGRMLPVGDVTERQRAMKRMFTGLFHVNSDEHRRHRRLLMPAFHKSRIDGYRDEMVRITEGALARYRPGEVRDVHDDLTEVTLRVATKTLFGEDEGERGVALARMMQQWLVTMFSPLMMLPRLDVRGMPYRRFLDLTNAIDRETAAIVRAKRARDTAGSTDMLSTLLAARDEDGSALDEDELIGHAGVIFAAGHETSTNALAWTLFLLSQHPQVARDLEDELDGVLRGAPPSVEALGKLPLLDAVVKESMRVLPPVPMHPRIVAEDSELGGHRLPAGSELFLSIFHMHHDPAVFPDPHRFDPRRWETIKPTVYEYNPFSAGPRMCIGASFAIMEIKIVLATMLQRFRLELPDAARIDPRVAITMAPHGGLHMRVRRRTDPIASAAPARGKVRDLVQLPS